MSWLTDSGEKNKRDWLLTALAVPVIQAASGSSWLTVFALGILCLGVCMGVEALGVPEVKWLRGIQWIWMTVILSTVLGWSVDCWPTDSPVIPGTLLLLAAWTVSGGKTFITFLFDSVFLWVVAIPIAFTLSRFTDLNVFKIYIAVQFADSVKCIVAFILLKKGVWLNNIVEN